MKRFLVIPLLLVALLAPFSIGSAPTLAQTLGGACADSEEATFVQLINAYRAENGLGSVALSQSLSVAADVHSVDLATNNFFNHTGSDGGIFVDRMAAAGYPDPTRGGEIIYAGSASAAEALTGWKNSPSHNAAMLDPNYTAVGIARAYNPGSDYQWYWTGTFGPTADGAGCYGEPEAAVQAAADSEEIAVSEEPTATPSDPVIAPTVEPAPPVEPTAIPEETTVPVEPTAIPEETIVAVEPTAIPEETIVPVEPTAIPEETVEPVEPTAIPEEPIEQVEPTPATDETTELDETTL